ncbi:glycosyltransferase [Oryzicola mucosus]|uniref:Glycosyltransferase n=1 Tax=Oryzicola mucosus TaxID=2767425 RepID=A0A8J6PSE9_9HYPH|nr:glycosyltransferase [Oryzicola mucosus]MBD0417555.1 glycosyltransferase [Oryzicola mucosus]
MTVPPIVFDVTQLLTRAGSPHITGIDRVERAWLEMLVHSNLPVYYLFERRRKVAILDASAGPFMLALIRGEGVDSLPLLSRFIMRVRAFERSKDRLNPFLQFAARGIMRLHSPRRVVRTAIMRSALGGPVALENLTAVSRLIARTFPNGGWYVSVSQRLPSKGMFSSFETAGLKSVMMIHDTIPLNFPEYCVAGAPEEMGVFVRLLAEYADIVLCNSQVTADDFVSHAVSSTGVEPKGRIVVAHLGLHPPKTVANDDHSILPSGVDPKRPIFMILGTIEPRKNHAFLLDVWDRMASRMSAEDMPQLIIAGAWGWKIDDFRKRVEKSPLYGRCVVVVEQPDDETVATLLKHTQALLMPSVAEGYGLPVLEAARDGIAVIAPPLKIYSEIVGDYPIYCELNDPDGWIEQILAFKGKPKRLVAPPIPTWQAHFDKVTKAMAC